MKKNLVAAVLAFFTIFALPVGAFAHDDISNTRPAANTTVQAGLFGVVVSFEEDILKTSDNAGEVVLVTAPDGTTVSNGCPIVDGKTLSTLVDLDKAGEYTVNWRSVSSDGHATEGTFKFKLENKNNYVSKGLAPVSEECEIASGATSSPTAEPTDELTETDLGAGNAESNLIGLGLGLGLVAIGTAAGAIVVDRKNKRAAKKAAK